MIGLAGTNFCFVCKGKTLQQIAFTLLTLVTTKEQHTTTHSNMRKIFLLASMLFMAQIIQAQEGQAFQFSVNHLALSVKDVNRSAEFYARVLQLPEITNRTKMEGIRWFGFADGKELHLVSTIKDPVTINKAVHLALTLQNFDAFVSRLEQLKVPYSDWPGIPNKVNVRADGIKQIYFQDPDGYWIEINSVAQK